MAFSVTVKFPDVSQPPVPPLYRVKTDREIIEQQIAVPGHGQFYEPGRQVNWRANLPAVFWMFGGSKTAFTRDQQILAWDMLKDVMIVKKFEEVYKWDKAFMNFTGFGDPSDPRRNYITGENAGYPDPEWDKIRVCANALITGVETYSIMQALRDSVALVRQSFMSPKTFMRSARKSITSLVNNNMLIVETIPHNNIPTWAELKPKKHLYFEAVSTTNTGDTTPFPQGGGQPVLIPLISSTVVSFPLSALVRVA